MQNIYCRITRRFQIFFIIFIIVVINFNFSFSQPTQASSTQQTTTIDRSYQEISSLKSKIKDLAKQIEYYNKELDKINTQLEINTQDVKETSSSLIELNRKIEKLNNDILDLLKKIESLSTEISNIKKDNIELQERIETIERSKDIVVLDKNFSQKKETIDYEIKEKSEINDIETLNKKIDGLKREILEIKEEQRLQNISEIKDPNLKRITKSPYLVLTTLIISIFALIAAF